MVPPLNFLCSRSLSHESWSCWHVSPYFCHFHMDHETTQSARPGEVIDFLSLFSSCRSDPLHCTAEGIVKRRRHSSRSVPDADQTSFLPLIYFPYDRNRAAREGEQNTARTKKKQHKVLSVLFCAPGLFNTIAFMTKDNTHLTWLRCPSAQKLGRFFLQRSKQKQLSISMNINP